MDVAFGLDSMVCLLILVSVKKKKLPTSTYGDNYTDDENPFELN